MKIKLFILIFILITSCINNNDSFSKSESKKVSFNEIPHNTSECLFKSKNNEKCWNRTGIYPIDSICEEFSCNLTSKDINEILLAKYIGDNGAFPNETAYVLWTELDTGYIKGFYTRGSENVFEKDIEKINW